MAKARAESPAPARAGAPRVADCRRPARLLRSLACSLSYLEPGSCGRMAPLPATPFMAGSGGGDRPAFCDLAVPGGAAPGRYRGRREIIGLRIAPLGSRDVLDRVPALLARPGARPDVSPLFGAFGTAEPSRIKMLRIFCVTSLHPACRGGGAWRCAVPQAACLANAGRHAARSSHRFSSGTWRNSDPGDAHMVRHAFRNNSRFPFPRAAP
jgi:hypothetical protein